MGVRTTAPRVMAILAMGWCLLRGAVAAQDVTGVHDPLAIHVQLPSFMTPVLAPDGTRTTAAMTLFLEIRVPEEAREVCQMAPRVQDAVLQDLFAHPVPQGAGNRMDLTGLGARLAIAVNQALGGRIAIVDVHVFEGVMTSGTGATKFARSQMCRSPSR